MKDFQVIVSIEKLGDRFHATKQITIDCRDADHAESVGKILASCAEQEKQIAQQISGVKNV